MGSRRYLIPILLAVVAYFALKPTSSNHFDECFFQNDKVYDKLIRNLKEYFIEIRNIKLHINEVGNPQAEKLVILLHGFPESGLVSWKYQLEHFMNSKSYRVVAPDMRGYNTSHKSDIIEESNSFESALDIIALIEKLGYKKAYVIGHDWGAATAFTITAIKPEMVEKLITMNGSYHPIFQEVLFSWPQVLKSWYMFLFQIPYLPEALLERSEFNSFMNSFCNSHSYSAQDIERLKEAWRQPGALTSMINYYRYLFKVKDSVATYSPEIKPPSLIIWGRNDTYLSTDVAEANMKQCSHPSSRIEFVESSHWTPHNQHALVNSFIDQFLKE